MGLLTTTIGAYPKPDYVNLPDWFDDLDTSEPTEGWTEAMEASRVKKRKALSKKVPMKLSETRLMQESIFLLMVKLPVKTTYTTTVDILKEWTL